MVGLAHSLGGEHQQLQRSPPNNKSRQRHTETLATQSASEADNSDQQTPAAPELVHCHRRRQNHSETSFSHFKPDDAADWKQSARCGRRTLTWRRQRESGLAVVTITIMPSRTGTKGRALNPGGQTCSESASQRRHRRPEAPTNRQ